MFIYYVFHIGLITESYKQNFFEQAQIYFALKLLLIRSPKEGTWIKTDFLHAKILHEMA